MAKNLIGISYSERNDNVVAPAIPNVEIIVNPICPQLVQTPALRPIIEPITPVPVFLEFAFIICIWKTAMLVTSAISPEVITIRIKLGIQSKGRWKVTYGSKNKNSLAYNRKIKRTGNKEAEIIQEEMLE